MKLNPFKSDKTKDKKKAPKSSAASSQINKLESQLSDWTSSLKQTEQRLKKLSGKTDEPSELELDPAHPHPPIKELSLEAEDPLAEDGSEDDEVDINVVKLEPQNPPMNEAGGKNNSMSESFKQLFESDDDEANPLANLIESLPEVTIDELQEDLKEIKNIIKDWQKR
jgi:hypothetical protein